MTHPLRLLIADRAPTCLGIRMALGNEVVICAEAETPEHAIRAAAREQPDLCLISGELAGEQFGAVRSMCRAAPHAAVVVLAQEENIEDLLECVRAGAVGYAVAPLTAERLRKIVRAVAAREAVIPRSMVLEVLVELRRAGPRGDGLTLRESQVLRMLRRGHTTGEIAELLQIAPVTVRRHISDLVHKLGVEDRSALTTSRAHPPASRSVGGVHEI